MRIMGASLLMSFCRSAKGNMLVMSEYKSTRHQSILFTHNPVNEQYNKWPDQTKQKGWLGESKDQPQGTVWIKEIHHCILHKLTVIPVC